MNEQEKRRCEAAVTAGLLDEFLPRDCDTLKLLGCLRSGDSDTLEAAVKEAKLRGEAATPGFTKAVESHVAAALEQIRAAEKEFAGVQ